MVSEAAIVETLRTIRDPEMPISIVDLGVVGEVRQEGSRVTVEILPTFVGCPALALIEGEVKAKVRRLPGVEQVEVRIVYDPPWSVDRITSAGRESLRNHGVTVPRPCSSASAGVESETDRPACPFCGSVKTRMESAFGPTRCRSIWYCAACRHSFEHLKRVSLPTLM
jgi:ring-1,2-phenylacetyl-CoA epoxidase subunit PaaD